MPHLVVQPSLPKPNNHHAYTALQAKRAIERLYRRLQKGANFEQLADQYSQDYGSFNNGGDLGWQKPDQFLPAFQEAISPLTRYELSRPFRTEFGYHIVQILDTRPHEIRVRHILLRVEP